MNVLKSIILSGIMLTLVLSARSQNLRVSATLDTAEILIGDQTGLVLTAIVPNNTQIAWPVFQDTLTRHIELIRANHPDTSKNKHDGWRQISQRLLITSFDSGYHLIPSIPFMYTQEGDTSIQTLSTLPQYLQVNSVEVDTTAAIKPIKPPLAAPVTFREILPWIAGILLAGLLGWLLYYYLKKRKKHEPLFAVRPKPQQPAHLTALEGLEELRYKKLWQSGKVKAYYTEMTDIVRNYIEDRFKVRAVEMTTHEILEGLKNEDINRDAFDKLKEILLLADLVKFAKEKPLALENDLSLNHSIDFVKETILRITETAGEGKQEETIKNEENA